MALRIRPAHPIDQQSVLRDGERVQPEGLVAADVFGHWKRIADVRSSGDQKIDLTSREVAILTALYERRGKAVSRDELFDLCWGRGFMPNSRALDQYVSALRKKIEIDPANPKIIRTVHGVGYRHEAEA